MRFDLTFLVAFACAANVELMILHDVSTTKLADVNMAAHLANIMNQLKTDYTDIKIGVSTFSDKPNVNVGIGTYAGWPGAYKEDWCYFSELTLTSDTDAAISAINNMSEGSGRDVFEGNFEAMVRAVVDSNFGWSDDATKIVMMVTDAPMGHSLSLQTLAEHVDAFNTPVRCVDGETKTAGGMGAYETTDLIGNWINPDIIDGYDHFADLIYRKCCVGDLSDDEMTEVEELKIKFGPLRVPSVKDFDIEVMKSDPEEHCRYHEYPNYSDIVTAYDGFKSQMVVYDPTQANKAVWEWVATDPAALGGGNIPLKLTWFASEDGMEEAMLTDLKELIEM